MNKRDMKQLRASIARDLIEGQGEPSPTRELLRQYAPLEGIVSDPPLNEAPSRGQAHPVENSMVPRATVAQNDVSPWHGATVAQHATVAPPATVARYAMVKGELRVPNFLNFSLFPTLDPYAKAVYYQLFLLSHGFRRDTCLISLAKLSQSVLMSQRKVQNTIAYLEKRGLIKRVEPKLGGTSKGNLYQVPLPATDMAPDATVAQNATLAPHATGAPGATVARGANNKEKYDDDLKNNHHQRPQTSEPTLSPVEIHSRAAAPRERSGSNDSHLAIVRAAYEKATGNRWGRPDSEAYQENGLKKVPVEKIISALQAVVSRTPAKINSFRYFIREILAQCDPRNGALHKKQLEKVVRRVRENSIGRADYSTGDFVEDVKCACVREAVPFDNDMFNEITG